MFNIFSVYVLLLGQRRRFYTCILYFDFDIIVNVDKQLPIFRVGELSAQCPNFRLSAPTCREYCDVETVVSTHHRMLRQ